LKNYQLGWLGLVVLIPVHSSTSQTLVYSLLNVPEPDWIIMGGYGWSSTWRTFDFKIDIHMRNYEFKV
jgi:hypothetical protein